MRGKTVAECMARGMLGDSCKHYRLFHRPLQCTFMNVVSSPCSRTGIGRDVFRGKYILPAPFVLCIRIFTVQRVREFYLSVAARSEDLMQGLCLFGSSAKSVGRFWLWKLAKCMIQGYLRGLKGSEAIRFSHSDFYFVV